MSNQELNYNLQRLASIVADLCCMIDARPATLPAEAQDWFENRLKNYCEIAQRISRGE